MYKDRTHTGITNMRRCYTDNVLEQGTCDIQFTWDMGTNCAQQKGRM